MDKDVKRECTICGGEGWVCEYHPLIKWGEGDGCCGGAGMPCSCNPISVKEKNGK